MSNSSIIVVAYRMERFMGISGIVLSGGLARRMGGIDKGLMPLAGKPMVAHVLERLNPQVDEILISANREIDRYAEFGFAIIQDEIDDFAGPLAGLHRGLTLARHPLVLSVPCDSPLLPRNLAQRLRDALESSSADLALVRTGNQVHPVFSLCRTSLKDGLLHFLRSGGRKMSDWHSTLHAIEVPFDDIAHAFTNINSPEDLRVCEFMMNPRVKVMNPRYSKLPILGICASTSDMGKTTLLTNLIPVLNDLGLRVSVIKHAHHSFDIDHPGKDSYRIREAGAVQTLISSRHRWALMTELSHMATPPLDEPNLSELVDLIDASLADLILVEGFKNEPIPKIEVYRPAMQRPLLSATDQSIIAIATDEPIDSPLPQLDLNRPEEVAAFILNWKKACVTS